MTIRAPAIMRKFGGYTLLALIILLVNHFFTAAQLFVLEEGATGKMVTLICSI